MTTESPARQPSCADDYDPDTITVAQALARIEQTISPLSGFQRVAVRDSLDRVLAEEICSPIDVPAHINSAMDGYALRATDLPTAGSRELEMAGTVYAGQPWPGDLAHGQCVRIMTGAVMPSGTDTVIMQEHCETVSTRVRIGSGHRRGQNVRQAGEDLTRGATVMATGTRIRAAELGLLASLGIAEVSVRRRPRVAFFSTGDELCSVGEMPTEGQIYDSNRYTLYGMLTRLGCDVIDMGVVRDRSEDLLRSFGEAAAVADAVMTSGGVSVGEADLVKSTLQRVGEIGFWKIAMKPGRPLAFGRLDGGALFFGLPGNPVAVMVTFYQIVQPALRRMMGERDCHAPSFPARSAAALRKRPGRSEYQRGVYYHDQAGQLCVRSTGKQGSGILSSVSSANCFIVLNHDCAGVKAGDTVQIQPFAGLM